MLQCEWRAYGMKVEGNSVSDRTLWNTRRPSKGNIDLPSLGSLLGGPYNSP